MNPSSIISSSVPDYSLIFKYMSFLSHSFKEEYVIEKHGLTFGGKSYITASSIPWPDWLRYSNYYRKGTANVWATLVHWKVILGVHTW